MDAQDNIGEVKSSNLSNNSKKRKSRKFYWFIVIVGMVVIMVLSVNLGYNINNIFNQDDDKNLNIDKEKEDEPTIVNLLTYEEALTIGNELYNNGKKAFYNKIYTKDGCISATVDGEYYMDCTQLYDDLRYHFAKDNKVGRTNSTMNDIYIDFITKNSDGKKYLDTTGESFIGEVQTTLSVIDISESQIKFNASSTILIPDSNNLLVVDRIEDNEFVIVREEDKWKISYFVALGV